MKCRQTEKWPITILSAKSKSNLRVFNTVSVGDQVHYPGVTAAYVAHLETIRILLNAAASEDAEISTADISDSISALHSTERSTCESA